MEDSGRLIYFDNAASTPLFSKVIDEFMNILTENYANPSAPHKAGLEVRRRLNVAEEEFLEILEISCETARVVWTSGGTEANNLAIFGCVDDIYRTEIRKDV